MTEADHAERTSRHVRALPHVSALDGVRGVAIIWVVFHNTTDRASGVAHGAAYLAMVFAHTGWVGVQLFFALSGFLITAGLLATQQRPGYFRNFYARRALRILPLYYAVLLALLVIWPLFRGTPFQGGARAPLWLFVANYSRELPYGFAHFWSLSVEEQFYLFWPIIVAWLPPRRLLGVCGVIAAAALGLRVIMVLHGADPWTIYASTGCRMDALALGGAGACLLFSPEERAWLVKHLAAIASLCLGLFIVGIPATHTYNTASAAGETSGYLILALCSALFVTALSLPEARAVRPVRAVFSVSALRSFGRYSYAIYIFHNLLHRLWGDPWMVAHFGQQPATQVILIYACVVLVASYLLAFVSYQLLEKRCLALKRYFVPGPAELSA